MFREIGEDNKRIQEEVEGLEREYKLRKYTALTMAGAPFVEVLCETFRPFLLETKQDISGESWHWIFLTGKRWFD